jgi:hypothetical protein
MNKTIRKKSKFYLMKRNKYFAALDKRTVGDGEFLKLAKHERAREETILKTQVHEARDKN